MKPHTEYSVHVTIPQTSMIVTPSNRTPDSLSRTVLSRFKFVGKTRRYRTRIWHESAPVITLPCRSPPRMSISVQCNSANPGGQDGWLFQVTAFRQLDTPLYLVPRAERPKATCRVRWKNQTETATAVQFRRRKKTEKKEMKSNVSSFWGVGVYASTGVVNSRMSREAQVDVQYLIGTRSDEAHGGNGDGDPS